MTAGVAPGATAGPRVLSREEVPADLERRAEGLPPGAYVIRRRHRTYLLVCAGERSTAGYGLRLTAPPGEQLDAGVVEAELLAPPPGALAAQVLTHPFLVVEAGRLPLHLQGAFLLEGGVRKPLPVRRLGW